MFSLRSNQNRKKGLIFADLFLANPWPLEILFGLVRTACYLQLFLILRNYQDLKHDQDGFWYFCITKVLLLFLQNRSVFLSEQNFFLLGGQFRNVVFWIFSLLLFYSFVGNELYFLFIYFSDFLFAAAHFEIVICLP